MGKCRQLTQLMGFMAGVHSSWAYKQLEAAVDGIVDFKVDESGEEMKDMIRIRSIRNVVCDRRWHQLKMKRNFEIVLDR